MHLGTYPGGALKDCRLMIPKNPCAKKHLKFEQKGCISLIVLRGISEELSVCGIPSGLSDSNHQSLQAWSLADPSLHSAPMYPILSDEPYITY